MNRTGCITALVAAVMMLVACGGGGSSQKSDNSVWQRPSLEYAYPPDGQQQVVATTPVLMRFTHAVSAEDLSAAVRLQADGGRVVPADVSRSQDGRSLKLTPHAALQPGQRYQVRLSGLQGQGDRPVQVPEQWSFQVAGTGDGQAFEVSRVFPDGETLPVSDMASFQLRTTRPLQPDSLVYGEGIALRDEDGELVPATVLVSGTAVTLDPDQDLSAGRDYVLTLTEQVRSQGGQALQPFSLRFTPFAAAPVATLVTALADSDGGERRSELSDDSINRFAVRSTLLGNEDVLDLSGRLAVQIGYAPSSPDAVPLRIARGSVLQGSQIQVKVGGELPAGFATGEIRLHLVSDAVGYLLPNSHSVNPASPKQVRLMMDAALTAEDPTSNAGFSQTLQQLELVGTAIREGNTLVIDAVSMLTPRVLGLETLSGSISLRIEAEQPQTGQGLPVTDATPPRIQTWLPGAEPERFEPGFPIVINFDEPLDPASVPGQVTVQVDGVEDEGARVHLDGASLVVTPGDGVRRHRQYQVQLGTGLLDLAGNAFAGDTLMVALPSATETPGRERTAFILSAYPGYPCSLKPGTTDLAAGIQGECQTRMVPKEWPSGQSLPVPTLPANRPLRVRFSQDMDPATAELGAECGRGSVRVERIDASGQCLAVVPGRLEMQQRTLLFHPQAPWEDGVLYRYVLMSSRSERCPPEGLCTVEGRPLQTNMNVSAPRDSTPDPARVGGDPLQVAFIGAPATSAVLIPLFKEPSRDLNRNLFIDADERQGTLEELPPNSGEVQLSGYSGLLTRVTLGCGPGETCPDQRILHLVGGLDADVIGWDESEQAVQVDIMPTLLMTTPLFMHAQALGGLIKLDVDIGPMVMRIQYAPDDQGRRTRPAPGWIRQGEDGLEMEVTLDLLLSIPGNDLSNAFDQSLKAYEISNVVFRGPLRFLPDGRITLALRNQGPLDVQADISLGEHLPAGSIFLQLPAERIRLDLDSEPLRH